MEHAQFDKNQMITVFFQGNRESRTQAARYTGKEGLDIYVSNGQIEHIFNPTAPQLLHNLFLYNELNDVEYGFSWNPLHWCSSVAHQLHSWYFNIYGTACMPHNKWSLMNIAGDEDITQCVNAIKECIKKCSQQKIVLFGCSRGASSLIVALTRLSLSEIEHINLVILEAPFASVPSLAYEYSPTLAPHFLTLLERCTLFQREQFSPLEAVASDKFPLTLPLLFVTSEVDTTVPVLNTMQLIDVLRKRDHQELTHLKLKHSEHSMMSLQDKEDQDSYYAELQRLYRKYI